MLVDRSSVYDALPAVTAPTLVVTGQDDPIFSKTDGERVAGRIPNARRVEVAGAGHLVPLEAAEAANDLLVEFLRALPSS